MGNEYPPDWDSRRRKVYRRDEYTCQNCGVQGGRNGNAELHAHHIVPKSSGGSHKISNLVTICDGCHEAVHHDTMAPTASSDTSKNTADKRGILWRLVTAPIRGFLWMVAVTFKALKGVFILAFRLYATGAKAVMWTMMATFGILLWPLKKLLS